MLPFNMKQTPPNIFTSRSEPAPASAERIRAARASSKDMPSPRNRRSSFYASDSRRSIAGGGVEDEAQQEQKRGQSKLETGQRKFVGHATLISLRPRLLQADDDAEAVPGSELRHDGPPHARGSFGTTISGGIARR